MPGTRAERARVHRAAGPRAPGGDRSASSRARSPIPTGATVRSSCSSRAARVRGAAPDAARRAGLAGAGAGGLPRAAARPARHRSLDAGRRARPADARSEQAAYLTHFRADSIVRDAEAIRARARRRAVERARPELRRLLRHDLPLARARGAARGVHHGRARAARRPDRRRLRARPTRAWSSATRATTRATRQDRARVLALHERARGARTSGCPPATGSPSRRFRQLGDVLGMSDGAEHAAPRARAARRTRPPSCTTSRTRPRSSATRSTRSCTRRPGPTARARAGPPSAAAGARPSARAAHRRARLPVDVRGLRRRSRPLREAAELLAEHEWPRLYDAGRGCARTRSPSPRRSTSTTCTSSATFAEETAALIGGLRPWVTNEYEHNGLRADGDRVLGRLSTSPAAGPEGEGARRDWFSCPLSGPENHLTPGHPSRRHRPLARSASSPSVSAGP